MNRKHWLSIALAILVALSVAFVAWTLYGRSNAAGDQATQSALDHNANQIRIVRAQRDSLKKVDSAKSAEIVAHRAIVQRAAAQLHVSSVPTDSTVIVERPVTDSSQGHALPRPDTLTLPLPIATFIREAKLQLALDDTLFHIKDLRIAALERADSLNVQRDSLHVVREGQLEDHARAEYRRGVKTGAKVILVTAALVGGAVKLVRLIAH